MANSKPTRGDLEESEDEAKSIRNDNAELADLLGVPEAELITAIGGPWFKHGPEHLDESLGGPVFIGRAGPSVLMWIDNSIGTLLVAQAVGKWINPGRLLWRAEDPQELVNIDGRHLARMAAAVDAAFEAKKHFLTICRFCGDLLAPEHAFGEECCFGCASTYFGIVY